MTLPAGYFWRVITWSEDLRKSLIPIPLNSKTYENGTIRIRIDTDRASYEQDDKDSMSLPFDPDREGFYNAWEHFFRPNGVFLRQTADVEPNSPADEAIRAAKVHLTFDRLHNDERIYHSLVAFKNEAEAASFRHGPAGLHFELFDPAGEKSL